MRSSDKVRAVENVTAVGWDNHRKFSQIAARDSEFKIAFRRRIEHQDRGRLREVLRSWPAGTPVVLEGTFGWSWVADELERAGHRPCLASSGKLAAWRKARGLAKSNRLDADLLSELMSEKSRWWQVWLPPAEVREQRELLRYRMGLVRTQTAFKNRMHAILHRHGIWHDHADLFGAAGRSFLQQLALQRASPLPASAKLALKGELQLLDHLRQQIAQATRRFRQQVQDSVIARRLMTLPGVSWILAYTLLAEIGQIGRFKSSKHLASYSLLAPRANDSGDDDGSQPQGRHVGFAGRGTLKWAFIEAAHGAIRSDARMREVFNRYTHDGNCNRNRGYITVARHLAVCAFVIWKKEIDYSPTPPPRPGSEKQRRRTVKPPATKPTQPERALNHDDAARVKGRSKKRPAKETSVATNRPGTGQPDQPMVAAV